MSRAIFGAVAPNHEAESAGTKAAKRIYPEVLEAMREIGTEISQHKPRKLTREMAERADVVVTMGCGDECPVIPGKRYIDWDLPDPKGRPLDEVRAIRDDIERRTRELAAELD